MEKPMLPNTLKTTQEPLRFKRKRADAPKFYAVHVGRKPGVYDTYAECIDQVKNFKNGKFKSFSTRSEADQFVQNGLFGPTQTVKFYAVRNGRVPGIYTSWDEARAQVEQWPKPEHRSFPTLSEAEEYLRTNQSPGVEKAPKKQKKQADEYFASGELDESMEAGTGSLPADSEDGFDYRIKLNPGTGKIEYKTQEERRATKMQAVGVSKQTTLHIYTDGSALSNGRAGAVAGVGVYFGPNDQRNVSEALAGERQTNQRAELTAIKRALDFSPWDRNVVIYSDSEYAIKCTTVWFQTWRNNGWLTASKKPVENRDLIESVVNKLDERAKLRVKTEFQWVKGHATDLGNNAADALAVEGARRARAGAG